MGTSASSYQKYSNKRLPRNPAGYHALMDFFSAATKTGTGWKHAAASMAVLMLAATGYANAQAPAEPHPTLLRELNRVREDGCDGRGATVSLLRENSALSRAAQLMAGGRKMDDALKAVDYRAVRAAQIAVRGATGPSALARRTLGKSCDAVMHAELAEAGFYQRGTQTWVVLAAPFSPPAVSQAGDVQARVLALVNEARANPRRCGTQAFAAARPLQPSSLLYSIAGVHAADMARYSYFSHTGRDGSDVASRATRAGYGWKAIGENIAAGQMQADTAVQGWLNSPGHCANIMAPAYTEMGTAFAVNTQSTAGIYWVQVFGTQR
jgi:uncharacterized protein YkwD